MKWEDKCWIGLACLDKIEIIIFKKDWMVVVLRWGDVANPSADKLCSWTCHVSKACHHVKYIYKGSL